MNRSSDNRMSIRAAFFWEGDENAAIWSLTENGKQVTIAAEDRSGAGGVSVEWETDHNDRPTISAVLAFPDKKLRNLRFLLEVDGVAIATNVSHEESDQWAVQVSSPLFIPAEATISWDGNDKATLQSLIVNTVELPLADHNRTGTGKIHVSWEMPPALNYTFIAELEFAGKTLEDLKFEAEIDGGKVVPVNSDKEETLWIARIYT